MNIMVTGGLGYIGSKLVMELAKENEVYVVDVGIYGNSLEKNEKIHLYLSDIRIFDWDILFSKGIDYVYHLAGISNDPGYGITEKIGTEINYKASVRLIDKCIEYKVERFIYPSSCSIYGHQLSNHYITEDFSPAPITEYAVNKVLVEKYILACAGQLKYTIIRPATVYGLSTRQRFDLVINDMIIKILNNQDVEVSNANNIRPSIYIDDLVDIYLKVINNENSINKIYNVANDNLLICDIYNRIQEMICSRSNLIDKGVMNSRSYNICSDKILSDFNNISFTPLEEGVVSLIKEIKKGKFDDYRINSNYYGNLKQPIFFQDEINDNN